MSNFQKKYYYQYTSLDNKTNVVELWQDTATTLTSEEIQAMDSPFSVELPSVSKFQPIRGTGCELNLLSSTDRKLFNGLYHVDPKEIMVKHYINGSINWYGYLNSELVSETYSELNNYPIQINGNDGFNLMERYKFVTDTNVQYTGITSQFNLLTTCIDKIGLPFSELRISLSTTFSGFTGASDKTILHESYINTSNYIDEDGISSDLRTVVESVLTPYGAFITQIGGNLYINDIHSLATNTNQSYKCYSTSTWNYTQTISSNNIISLSGVGYQGTSQMIELSGGKNLQKVTYSPYADKILIDTSIASESEFTTVPSSYSMKNNFHYKTLTGNINYVENSPATFEESYYTDPDEAQIYLRFAKQTSHTKILSSIHQGYYAVSAGKLEPYGTRRRFIGVTLRLTGEVMLTTKDNPYDDNGSSEYKDVQIRVGLNIGTGATPADYWVKQATTSSSENISDTFIPFTIDNVLGVSRYSPFDVNGYLYVDIYTNVSTLSRNGVDDTPDAMKEIWFKNLKVEYIQSETGASIQDKDIEFTSTKNNLFLDEADQVSLICGTDKYRADRGKIMAKIGNKYPAIYNWTRNNQTYKVEELLCNSLASNNNTGYHTISGLELKNGFNHTNVLQDSNLVGKNLMVSAIKYDYYNNVSQCTLVEIKPDDYSIVIS
jgi:hypothetical protein